MTIASDLREMNDEQLTAELAETRKQLFELRFQAATERLDAPSELRKLRKTIARILTIQRERELQTSPAS
jgi:large subunit ribosomal protein L29